MIEPLFFSRIWEMPHKYTFRMRSVDELLKEEVVGVWADPFAGLHSPASIRNDADEANPAEHHMDGLDFLKQLGDASVDGVLFDPPYSVEQALRKYKPRQNGTAGRAEYWARCKDEIARIVKAGGKAICFGWDSCGIGKSRGFNLVRGKLICHGACHNDKISAEQASRLPEHVRSRAVERAKEELTAERAARPSEPSAPAEWRRQESCSECDGDGCANCAPQTSAELCPICGKSDAHTHQAEVVTRWFKSRAPQPIPKELEKIVAIVRRYKNVPYAAFDVSVKLEQMVAEIEALRPYFPPASQTPEPPKFPNGDLMPIHWCPGLKKFVGYSEWLCSMHKLNSGAVEYTPATPASTARTDGWVSVEERLPKHCNPVEVMAIRFNGEVMRDYSFFCDGEWDGVEDQGYRIKPKIVYWHELLPLPAAPGSVPHKANLLDEDKSLRPTSKGFVGVPQAEPPKEGE